MSGRRLTVLLGPTIVGPLTRVREGQPAFDDDEAYRAQPPATPLSLSMPTAGSSFPASIVQPWITGLIPDDPDVLRRWSISTTHAFTLYEQDVNEHLCLAAVEIAGLSAARSQVRLFGSERAIVLTRYDRRNTTGGWMRVHQEDACQALSVMPGRKYQSDGGPSAKQTVELFRRTFLPADAETDILRFADTLAWNWLIGGSDGHCEEPLDPARRPPAAGRRARLAPLYDVSSGLAYWRDRDLSLAKKIGTATTWSTTRTHGRSQRDG